MENLIFKSNILRTYTFILTRNDLDYRDSELYTHLTNNGIYAGSFQYTYKEYGIILKPLSQYRDETLNYVTILKLKGKQLSVSAKRYYNRPFTIYVK